MDDLERRTLSLEHTIASDRQLTQLHIAMLYQRLQAIEAQPSPNPLPAWLQGISLGSALRILLAIVIPLGVWLVTGDITRALRAIR